MKNNLKKAIVRLGVIALFYPWLVGFTAGDTTPETIIDFLFGSGSYQKTFSETLREWIAPQYHGGMGCSSGYYTPGYSHDIGTHTYQEQHNNVDVGTMVRHELTGGGVLIAKAGYAHINTGITNSYMYTNGNPSYTNQDNSQPDTWWYALGVGLSGEIIGLEGGVQVFDRIDGLDNRSLVGKVNPFGKVRFGYEDSWYYTFSYLWEPTYMSSGGIFQTGFSIPLLPETEHNKSSIWLGYGAGPWDASNLIARLTIAPNSFPLSFIVSGSYNINSDISASSVTGGIRYSFK